MILLIYYFSFLCVGGVLQLSLPMYVNEELCSGDGGRRGNVRNGKREKKKKEKKESFK